MAVKVFYHANCTDGSGAALAAFISMGDTAEYIPVQYNMPMPDVGPSDVIYIVDFSYSYDQLIELGNKVAKVVVLDHHKTARQALEHIDHPNITVQFDMEQSGAVLTWKYFHPDRAVPPLLSHIQDRDLWRFNMKGTKEIHRALGMYPDWIDWAQFLFEVGQLIPLGAAIIKFLDVQIDRIISHPPREFFATDEIVPMYNIPGFLISDACDAALRKYPECRYAVGYIHLPDRMLYSLRSRQGSGVDVAEIALRYGGGGHENAAGFRILHDQKE